MNLVKEWRLLIRREFSNYGIGIFQRDLLAALTVAAVALPLALAFGVASGVDAAAGLVTAVVAGILIGALSGAPYQISGPTGAMAAVLVVLASRYGLQGMWVAGLIAGAILVVLGIFRLGRVVALIPAPVISGFTSGIALIIAFGQIDNALGISTPPAENVVAKLTYYATNGIDPNLNALALTLLVIVIMLLWPRLRFSQRIPGSLVSILVATAIVLLAGLDVPSIGAIPRSIILNNRLSPSGIPWPELRNLVIPALSIAALGAIESLLCGAVGGNMTGIRLHNSVELVAQGIGNMVIPFFGGVPATAAIARTSVNIKSGGVTRLTSILHGVILLLVALLFAPAIGRIPLAALAGVLMVTAWRMNEWSAIHFYFGKRLKHAMAAFLITLAATVFLDLTQAIIIGFGISTLIFMSQISDLNISRQPVDVERLEKKGQPFIHPEHTIGVYYLSGPLFFAASRKLLDEVEAQDQPGARLILSMRGVPMIDATGIEVLREMWHRQQKGGGDLLLAGLQPRVENLLQRSGFLDEISAQHVFWSADEAIRSLGAVLTPIDNAPIAEDSIDSTLVIMPHEDRANQQI